MVWFLFFVSLVNLLIGVIVLTRGPHKKINLSFGALCFASSVWIFNNFLTGISESPSFWLRGAYAWGGFVPSSGLLWVLYLCHAKNIKLKAWLIYIAAIFFFISSYFDGLIIDRIDHVYVGQFDGTTGPLFLFYVIFFFGTSSLLLFTLFLSLRKAQGLRRAQLLYVFIGAFLYIAISDTVSFLLPLFGYNKLMSIDSPSSLLFLGLTAYAITRYRFMDVRLVVFR